MGGKASVKTCVEGELIRPVCLEDRVPLMSSPGPFLYSCEAKAWSFPILFLSQAGYLFMFDIGTGTMLVRSKVSQEIKALDKKFPSSWCVLHGVGFSCCPIDLVAGLNLIAVTQHPGDSLHHRRKCLERRHHFCEQEGRSDERQGLEPNFASRQQGKFLENFCIRKAWQQGIYVRKRSMRIPLSTTL